MQISLHTPVWLITGGTSGIGKAMALSAYAHGARVAVCGRNQSALEAMSHNMDPERFLAVRADVSLETDCKAFIEAAAQHFGQVDVLVNNAGISMRALFKDLESVDVLKRLMDINFWGTVYCCRYALPYLLQSKGSIVGISSIAGYRGLPGRSGYSASKFAMQGFLETLRTEMLHSGVNILWASPGFTASNIRNTALNQSGLTQEETPLDESKLMTAETVAEAIYTAVQRRKRTLVLTGQGKLTVWMNKLFPALTDSLVYNHFKKEPGSPLR